MIIIPTNSGKNRTAVFLKDYKQTWFSDIDVGDFVMSFTYTNGAWSGGSQNYVPSGWNLQASALLFGSIYYKIIYRKATSSLESAPNWGSPSPSTIDYIRFKNAERLGAVSQNFDSTSTGLTLQDPGGLSYVLWANLGGNFYNSDVPGLNVNNVPKSSGSGYWYGGASAYGTLPVNQYSTTVHGYTPSSSYNIVYEIVAE